MPVPPPHRVTELYQTHFRNPRRERLFLSSVGFGTAFATARAVTDLIRHGGGPFRNISMGGRHLHHLVFGIAGLLGTGYLWLIQVGTGGTASSGAISRTTSFAYGAASALTLDEFALWLNLEDVYWAKEGRESIDAVVLFGAVLSVGFWGAPFFRGLLRELQSGERALSEWT